MSFTEYQRLLNITTSDSSLSTTLLTIRIKAFVPGGGSVVYNFNLYLTTVVCDSPQITVTPFDDIALPTSGPNGYYYFSDF